VSAVSCQLVSPTTSGVSTGPAPSRVARGARPMRSPIIPTVAATNVKPESDKPDRQGNHGHPDEGVGGELHAEENDDQGEDQDQGKHLCLLPCCETRGAGMLMDGGPIRTERR
jgi:hypothetical protein